MKLWNIAIIICCALTLLASPPEKKDRKDSIETVDETQFRMTSEAFERIENIVREADRCPKKGEAVRMYQEAFIGYEKAFAKKTDYKLFLKHLPKMLHCADNIIRGNPNKATSFKCRISEICRKNLKGKKIANNVALKNKQLFLHIGLDHDLKLTLRNKKLYAAKGGGFCGIYSHGGVGTHFTLASDFPDLFFGYPACWVNNEIWELNTPLSIISPVRRIKYVKLLFSGRKNVAINSKGVCSIRWNKNNIWLSDHAAGPERYKIMIVFE